jgi:CelD/BcsL family acetyltransferase involved in cellulose biosynthesis
VLSDIDEIDKTDDFLNNKKQFDYHHAMKVIWNALPRKAWQEFHAQHGGSLQQSWAYGEAMRTLGVQTHRAAVMDGKKVLALAQFIGRRYLHYLSMASCTRGPVWSPALDAAAQNRIYKELKKTIPTKMIRVTLFSPEMTLAQLPPESVKGLNRVMTGYSTVTLDLRRDEETLRAQMDRKWRNRVFRPKRTAPLQVQLKADMRDCRHLLEKEEAQRASRHFHGLPTDFVPAFINGHERPEQGYFVATTRHDNRTIAAMLFLLHGQGATYHIGWSDEEGRQLSAHNVMLWQAMLHLKKQGISRLDLGGINTHDLPGISRFKLATGGQVLTLAGTYF